MSDIRQQDEILQMMYWMRGEKLAESVTVGDLDRFLQIGRDAIMPALAALADKGFLRATVPADGAVQYTLTDVGIEEGKRRFVDEFSGVLGHSTHLECGNEDCDCHEPGFEGDCLFASAE